VCHEPRTVDAANFHPMTARRSLGLFTLLAMMHFIVVGTASACAVPRDGTHASASAHSSCAPGSSHSKSGDADRATELPCCAALASCATAPLIARTVAVLESAPRVAVACAIAEHAPRADTPAPELPPPRA
jgi:hypothetical protein